jgi:hypothetical protein
MATPITWRNVNAPNLSGAAAMMEQARQSFSSAFNTADNLIDQRQAIEQGNQENQVNLNTDQFEQMLRSRYQSPEELQAARQSGELDALRQQFGEYGLDTERTGAEAIDTLISGLQSRARTDQEYTDYQRGLNNREAREAHDVAIAEGRFDDAARIRAETDFLNEGAMARDQTTAEQNLENLNWTRENRANTRADRAEQKRIEGLQKQGQALASEMLLNVREQGQDPTDARNQLAEALFAIPGMTMDIATPILTNADNTDFLMSQLSKRDQAKKDVELAKVDKALSKNEFTRWRNTDETPAAATNRILANAKDKIADGWDQQEIHDFALMAMTEGFDLGTGTKQALPPEAVEYILNHPDVGEWWGGNPDAHVRRLIIDNPYWAEKLNEDALGRIDKRTIENEYLKKTLGESRKEPTTIPGTRPGDSLDYFFKAIDKRGQ